jgi:hypothetical protein
MGLGVTEHPTANKQKNAREKHLRSKGLVIECFTSGRVRNEWQFYRAGIKTASSPETAGATGSG